MSIKLRTFSNRNLVAPSVSPKVLFEKGNYWTNIDEELNRNDKLDVKYPGYAAYETFIKINHTEYGTPSKSQIVTMITFEDKEFVVSNTLEYTTIKIHDGNETIHGFVNVCLDDNMNREGLKNLPCEVWKQIGGKGSQIIILINLKRFICENDPEYNLRAKVNSDDVNGDLYHSYIRRIIVLRKRV